MNIQQRTIVTTCVLILLYWAYVLRDWSSVKDLQTLLTPYITFAFGVGILLSVFEWERPNISVFLISSSIPALATLLKLILNWAITNAHAGAGPDINLNLNLTDGQVLVLIILLILIPILICVFHGLISVAGFHCSTWIKKSIVKTIINSEDPNRISTTTSLLNLITGIVGLLSAIVAAIASK